MSGIKPANTTRQALDQCKRVVVKVGSSLLTGPDNGLQVDKIDAYATQIAQLSAAGYQVILVSSGAVAAGCLRLGWSERPEQVHLLQAAASVGQMGLVQSYESTLRKYGCGTAMIMLTHDDLADRQRYLNARATLNELLSLGIVPVINENDTVATDEIRFGDNDTLAALVTNLIEADLLTILTDVEGLMDADPRSNPNAQRISVAESTNPELAQLAGDSVGALGRGGMVTKLRAARLAARSGAHTLIASGEAENILPRLLAQEDLGTLLAAELTPMTARKRWIAGQLRAKGDLVIDAGAAAALRQQGVSLLAAGVLEVRGEFVRGDVVRCITARGETVAQGLINYASSEAVAIKGRSSDEFAATISYTAEPELMHRDNLVLL
jgi:glutamate 5-kinase